MTLIRRLLGIMLASGIALAIAWSSVLPARLFPSSDAIVRVSMGARPQRLETCRTVADSELANVLPQMRQQMICEGVTARYRLEVRRNDSLILNQLVRGGGLRHDRQLYVSQDLSVPSGPISLDVRFVRLDTVAAARATAEREDDERDDDERVEKDSLPPREATDITARARRESERRRRRQPEAVPPDLRLAEQIVLSPREVVIVTYDPDARALVLRREPR